MDPCNDSVKFIEFVEKKYVNIIFTLSNKIMKMKFNGIHHVIN